MESRPLGQTGLKIPPIALGTVKLGRNRDVKYPARFELPSDAEVNRLLEGAWELGVRCFDTAPAYGRSEERLAPFVARHRDEMVLCTKAGETYDESGSHYAFDGATIRASVERSCRRLGTDRLDVVLLHSNGEDARILTETDALETLLLLREEGGVRSVGISLKTVRGIELAASRADVIMAPYSVEDRALGAPLAAAARAGCGILTIKTLGSGHLAASGPAAVQRALTHVLAQEWVAAAVVGTLDLAHLRQAVAVATELERA